MEVDNVGRQRLPRQFDSRGEERIALVALTRSGINIVPTCVVSVEAVLSSDEQPGIREWVASLPATPLALRIYAATIVEAHRIPTMRVAADGESTCVTLATALRRFALDVASSGIAFTSCLHREYLVVQPELNGLSSTRWLVWLYSPRALTGRAIGVAGGRFQLHRDLAGIPEPVRDMAHTVAEKGFAPCLLEIVQISTETLVRSCLLVDHRRDGGRVVIPHFSDQMPDAPAVLLNGSELELLVRFTPAGLRVATGPVAISPETLLRRTDLVEPPILTVDTLLPRHAAAIAASAGVVVRNAGPATHTVVAARGLGKAVAITAALETLEGTGSARLGDTSLADGDWITIDEGSGRIFRGRGEIALAHETQVLDSQVEASVQVYVNADSAESCRRGLDAGARGVGLCRSEASATTESDLWALAATVITVEEEAPAAWNHFRALIRGQVSSILRELDGQPLHYRLLDVAVRDIATARDAANVASFTRLTATDCASRIERATRGSDVADFRAARLGLQSGIYAAQIRAVVDAVRDARLSGTAANVAVVIPLITSVQELVVVKELVVAAASAAQVSVRVGVMLETPRATLLAAGLAAHCDLLCVGTNDLTQFAWAADRGSGQWIPWYADHQLVSADPFCDIDTAVLELINQAVESARYVRPGVEVVVCGDHASRRRSVQKLVAVGVSAVSCRADAVADIAAIRPLRTVDGLGRVMLPVSRASDHAAESVQRIELMLRGGAVSNAQVVALEWANGVASEIGLPEVVNWKFFKRDIAAVWFGGREFRRFIPPWVPEDVVDVVEAWTGRGETVRFSSFPSDIACHAISETFPSVFDRDSVIQQLARVDRTSALEVFPQQSVDRLCFRIAIDGHAARIEAGLGQAMYVFETERGRHETAQADLASFIDSGTIKIDGPKHLTTRVERLLLSHGEELLARIIDAAAALGTPWFAVEGYYDADRDEFPVVCDIDLPHDLAFHVAQ